MGVYYKNLTANNSTFQIYNNTEIEIKEAQQHTNLSSIDLFQCERLLRLHCNIPSQETLTVFKKDTFTEGLVSQVEYMIFSFYGDKLDLSICSDSKITVTIPLNITSNEYQLVKNLSDNGVDVFNNKDPFFQNICFPYVNNSQDMPRCDRVLELLLDNSTLSRRM